jgi:hypothetical protein
MAAFTDGLVAPVRSTTSNQISLRGEPVIAVYLAFYLLINTIAWINVERARRRCQTRSTKRRMGYLQIAMLTPVIGVFPFSLLLEPGQEFTVAALFVVNLANFVVILMLLFLAYPLSFFGSRVPDRVVKSELLRFMLRGPATGLLALVVILFTQPTSEVLGLPGQMFMPFATVAVILLWQWLVSLRLPWLEQRLIYNDETDEQMGELQRLSERALSRRDLYQLIEAAMEAVCDFLGVDTAFVLSFADSAPELVGATGSHDLPEDWTSDITAELIEVAETGDAATGIARWNHYWIIPLYSKRIASAQANLEPIGIMGLEARSEQVILTTDERKALFNWVRRIAQALDDTRVLDEIYAALEGLLPQLSITRTRAADVEFRPGRTPRPAPSNLPEHTEMVELVHAALRHYWGGPGLGQSHLLELNIVQNAVEEYETPVKALREILLQAIETLRPEGERNLKSPEWTLYNILHLRFIEQRKARDTARRLYMAEASLYRKQSVAIEAVAGMLMEMEQNAEPVPVAPPESD